MAHAVQSQVPSVGDLPTLSLTALLEHQRLASVNPGHYADVVSHIDAEIATRDPSRNYRCMKCGHGEFENHQIRATRSWLSSLFSVETAQYRALVCARCHFTEFYQGDVPIGQQALDFLLGR
jgi:predicted nucleic-acid-binding Zn-ribbon protein